MQIKHPIQLKSFQKEGVRAIQHHHGNVLLADDMRLGKTVQTLYWLSSNTLKKTPVIIICPSIAKWVWQEQARDNFGLKTIVLEGTEVDKSLHKTNNIFIVNYEILKHWIVYLKRLRPKTIIIDECHYAKNPAAQRTKATRRMCKGYVHIDDGKEYLKILSTLPKQKQSIVQKSLMQRARHIIAISGTPLVNRPAELFPILNILWPKTFKNFPSFGARYCHPTFENGKLEYKGAENLGELHRKLKRLGMIRRLKKDVIKNYKKPIHNVIPIDITDPSQYTKRHKAYIRAVRRATSNKSQRMGSFLKLKQIAAETKLSAVLEWIDNYLEDTDDKIVVFAHHKKIIKAIKNHYGQSAVVIDGMVLPKRRIQIQKQFKTKKSIRVFIGNMQACGMAVSLKSADTIAFAELPLTPGDLRQCEDRIFDITKNKQLFIYYLVAHGTIEEIVCRLLQHKAKIISKVLDGSRTGSQIKIYDQLERMIRKQ